MTAIIAEAGVNHNGDPALALRLVDVAADAGADCVKFQTFRADKVAVDTAPKAAYQAAATGVSESQLAMLRKLELPEQAWANIAARCGERGIEFLSTPFDEDSAASLHTLGVRRFKVPSGELTNLAFLAHLARYGKPVLLSTGMGDLEEVRLAVQALKDAGAGEVTVLHCVTDYPADPADANLRAMATMRQAFGTPVGWSDHMLGNEVAFAAAALGADVIEKHFTLDRTLSGPDHAASMEPAELAALVAGVRKIERALGDGKKIPTARELANRSVVRRSLVAATDIPRGAAITEAMIAARRPGDGLPPAMLPQLVGRRAMRDIRAGTLLSREMLA
jgi:N,N'-diacetyllegionaminate synthase